jgi:AcrR family transcriptional regulator
MAARPAPPVRRSSPDSTRQRLLRSGLVLARRRGLRKLTVRALAEHAGVNLGSFVYHFGSRDAFNDELMERWYAPLWTQLQGMGIDETLAPIERFRRLVLCLFEWVSANRVFVGHLILDVAAGEPAAQRFLRTIAGRHPALIMASIREAQAAGQIVAGEPLHLMAFTMAATGAPILIGHGLSSQGLVPTEMARALLGIAIARDQIEQRLQWVIAGIGIAKETR